MQNTTWILVADAGKARIYHAKKLRLFNESAGEKDLELISEHTHEASRKMDNELVSDRWGTFSSGTFYEATDPKRHEAERFALELTKQLDHARTENSYHEVILIAPPAFMGLLNQHLSKEVNKLVSLRIEKDYTHINTQELVAHLKTYV